MNLRRDRVPVDERDLLRICYLYYREEKTQEEISSLFGLSRFKVNRLLKEARNKGLVTIHIHDPLEKLTELEFKLTREFGLKGSIVVRANRFSEKTAQEQVGEAGAEYLTHVIDGFRVLGVSWGRTLYHVVKNVKPLEARDLTVVQISGGLGTIEGTDTNILTMMLSQKFGGRAYVIQAPVIVKNRLIKDTLLGESKIREALDRAKRSDGVILGIGAVDKGGGLWRAGFLDQRDEVRLKKAGAVGAMGGRFYNVYGETCFNDLDDRIIGLTLDELRKIKHKIGIASGSEKIDAILGALRGKLLDVFITDEKTAEGLLAHS
jgi:deoxyribonucleoside regulator